MKSYSFANLTGYLNAVQISGWSEGDAVMEVEFPDMATTSIGAGGEMVASLHADRSMKLTIKTQQTSKTNKYLMGLIELQRMGPKTFVPFTFAAKDSYRTDKIFGDGGVCLKIPKISRGLKANEVQWDFQFERGGVYLGDPGFNGLASAVAEAVTIAATLGA